MRLRMATAISQHCLAAMLTLAAPLIAGRGTTSRLLEKTVGSPTAATRVRQFLPMLSSHSLQFTRGDAYL